MEKAVKNDYKNGSKSTLGIILMKPRQQFNGRHGDQKETCPLKIKFMIQKSLLTSARHSLLASFFSSSSHLLPSFLCRLSVNIYSVFSWVASLKTAYHFETAII